MTPALLIGLALLVWPASPAARAVAVLARSSARAGGTDPGSWGRPNQGQVRRFAPTRGLPSFNGRSGRNSRDGQVLVLLDGLAAALRSGLPTAHALGVVAGDLDAEARHQWIDPVLQAARDGRETGPVWRRVSARTHSPDIAALARAWQLSEAHGVPLAEAVESAARTCRARLEHHRKVEAGTAGARATLMLLTLLPLASPLLGYVVGVPPAQLYGSWYAIASVVVGIILLVIGRVVVTRMIHRVERDAL